MCSIPPKNLDLFWLLWDLILSIYIVQFFFSLQLIIDVNIAVGVEAVQAIGNLALGLRTSFSASSRFLLPVLLVSVHFIKCFKFFCRATRTCI